MDFSTPFSILNEKLKPRLTTTEVIHSSLTRLEGRQLGSLRGRSLYTPQSILPAELDPKVPGSMTMEQYLEEREDDTGQEDAVSDDLEEGNCADLVSMNNSCLITKCSLNDVGEEELADEDSSSLQSEERDNISEPTTDETTDSLESVSLSDKSESSPQMSFVDGTLPDLINSGRPLGRRRTLGHVSTTLNEVRREVELSRRRSIKLKAQVDKLEESRSGPGWSEHREGVRDEVLSILRLLNPLTESQYKPSELCQGENNLDIALSQLKIVARKLAFDHTKQEFKSGIGEEDSAILTQALRDRDEAIEKKKAMEAELLRSKTEMMSLNNQLLEAVQRRLELSLELEAWKEDVQLILQHQLQMQQEAEQVQKKPSRLGILRRINRAPMQRPTNFLLSPPTSPSTNPNQIFIPRAAGSPTTPIPSPTSSQRNWRDRLRRGKNGRQQEEVGAQDCEHMDGFQVVSLD